MMALQARLRREQRTAARYPSEVASTVRHEDDPIDGMVVNISVDGFAVEPSRKLLVGETVNVGFSGLGVRRARIIWRKGGLYGCSFSEQLPLEAIGMVLNASTTVRAQQLEMPTGASAEPDEELRPSLPIFSPSAKVIVVIAVIVAGIP